MLIAVACHYTTAAAASAAYGHVVFDVSETEAKAKLIFSLFHSLSSVRIHRNHNCYCEFQEKIILFFI
jgi:hypothetical protein